MRGLDHRQQALGRVVHRVSSGDQAQAEAAAISFDDQQRRVVKIIRDGLPDIGDRARA